MYVCCLQEVIWRGQSFRMLVIEGRRYELWWSGRGDRVGGMGIMMKE